jgi:predicted RNA-binding protein with RPS1 domain
MSMDRDQRIEKFADRYIHHLEKFLQDDDQQSWDLAVKILDRAREQKIEIEMVRLVRQKIEQG